MVDDAGSLIERARLLLDAAERQAVQVRLLAEQEAEAYLEDARRRVDAFAAGRARRIAETGDRLLAHADALAERAARAEQAGRLRESIDTILDALADAAEAIAAEARRAPIALPPLRAAAPAVEPGDDDAAAEHVAAAAALLPQTPKAPEPTQSPGPLEPGGTKK